MVHKPKKPTASAAPKHSLPYRFIMFWLKFIVLFAITMTLLFVITLFTNRPNYRDLEHEFNKLNIPADWQVVDRYDVTGYKGITCANTGIDISCPELGRTFTSKQLRTDEENNRIIKRILSEGGYKTTRNCHQIEKHLCYNNYKGVKRNIEASAGFGVKDGVAQYFIHIDRNDYLEQ